MYLLYRAGSTFISWHSGRKIARNIQDSDGDIWCANRATETILREVGVVCDSCSIQSMIYSEAFMAMNSFLSLSVLISMRVVIASG